MKHPQYSHTFTHNQYVHTRRKRKKVREGEIKRKTKVMKGCQDVGYEI